MIGPSRWLLPVCVQSCPLACYRLGSTRPWFERTLPTQQRALNQPSTAFEPASAAQSQPDGPEFLRSCPRDSVALRLIVWASRGCQSTWRALAQQAQLNFQYRGPVLLNAHATATVVDAVARPRTATDAASIARCASLAFLTSKAFLCCKNSHSRRSAHAYYHNHNFHHSRHHSLHHRRNHQ